MNKKLISKRKVLLIGGLITLLFAAYLFKDIYKIYSIRSEAIDNYNFYSNYFDSLKTSTSDEFNYSIRIIDEEFVSISYTNVNSTFMDSFLYENPYEAIEYKKGIRHININQLLCSEIPKIKDRKLIDGENIYDEWDINFSGTYKDASLKLLLESIGVDYENVINQISLLKIINSSNLDVHEEGIEITYDKMIRWKTGCIVSDLYPVKYNLGTNYRIKNEKVKFKEISDDVKIYIVTF